MIARCLPLAIAALLAGCSIGGGGDKEPQPAQRSVKIVSLLPKQGRDAARAVPMADAIEAALQARAGRAGRFRVTLVRADTTDPVAGQETERSCTGVGRRYADDRTVVGIVGPLQPACAANIVPTLNQAGLIVVSPTEAYPGFTHEITVPGDAQCFRCAPDELYPTGVRTYARMTPPWDSEGRAAAQILRRLGTKRAYAISDSDAFATPYLAGFLSEAHRAGVRVVQQIRYGKSSAPERIAADASRANADAVFIAAATAGRAPSIVAALRRQGFDDPIVVPSPVATEASPTQLKLLDSAYETSNLAPLSALPTAAQRFARDHGAASFAVDVARAYEAANMLLDAIAASDGSRAEVRKQLFGLSRKGILGTLRFNANGDVQPQEIAVSRVHNGNLEYRETVRLGTDG